MREALRGWWLKHHRGANTPNWDLVVECHIEGKSGLILVEAKANHPELKAERKPLSDDASNNSRDNEEQIRIAINAGVCGVELLGLCRIHQRRRELPVGQSIGFHVEACVPWYPNCSPVPGLYG